MRGNAIMRIMNIQLCEGAQYLLIGIIFYIPLHPLDSLYHGEY